MSLSVYIHIPFCKSKCSYCSFCSIPLHQYNAAAYWEAVEEEARLRLSNINESIDTVYVGGGTPTALSEEVVTRVCEFVGKIASPGAEITYEANPCSLSKEKLTLIQTVGRATRISLGVQTFNEKGLSLLGRAHSVNDTYRAIDLLHAHEVAEIGFDLIFAWAGQSCFDWEKDLQIAVKLCPTHISCYNLTYEQGTAIYQSLESGMISAVDENIELELFRLCDTKLSDTHPRYELGNFAKPEHRSRHNQVYWTGGSYIGLGASAHSFDGNIRTWNSSNIDEYVQSMSKGIFEPHGVDRLPPLDRLREIAMLWLRMTDGIDSNLFFKQTGYDLNKLLYDRLKTSLQDGLAEWDQKNHLRLTERGREISNRVFEELI